MKINYLVKILAKIKLNVNILNKFLMSVSDMKKDVIKKRELVKPVSVSMTESEKAKIKKAADKEGVSFSDFVRQSALHLAS